MYKRFTHNARIAISTSAITLSSYDVFYKAYVYGNNCSVQLKT